MAGALVTVYHRSANRRIEANEKAPAVTVNVNQQTNNLVAGYVIRLPASRAEGAPMIEEKVSP